MSDCGWSSGHGRPEVYGKSLLRPSSSACVSTLTFPSDRLNRRPSFTRMFARLARLEGRSVPAFLNTHPATTQRVQVRARSSPPPMTLANSLAAQKLESLLPDAYAIRAASPQCAGLNDSYAAFRDAFSRGGWRAPSDGGLTWGW